MFSGALEGVYNVNRLVVLAIERKLQEKNNMVINNSSPPKRQRKRGQ